VRILIAGFRSQVPEGVSTWSSPDVTLTIRFDSKFRTSVQVSIPDQLKMKVWVEADAELISDPPIYSLSFDIEWIATTPEVHGVSSLTTLTLHKGQKYIKWPVPRFVQRLGTCVSPGPRLVPRRLSRSFLTGQNGLSPIFGET
jgi:hypothetical protein